MTTETPDDIAEQQILVDDFSERLVLGSVLSKTGLMEEATASMLSPGDFHSPAHATIFARIQEMHRRGDPINPYTLKLTLEEHGELGCVGGFDYVLGLDDGLVIRPSIALFARKVQELARRRQLRNDLLQLAGEASTTSTQLSELVRNLQMLSAQYGDVDRAETKLRFRSAAQVLAEKAGESPHVAYPYLFRGAVTEIVGQPKRAGKTTLITHMVKAVLEGLSFIGQPTTKTRVVYLTEQSDHTFRAAMARAKITACEELTVLAYKDTFGRPWREVAAATIGQCERSGAGLLVVDTISQFAHLGGDTENNSGDALEAMKPLQQAAAKGLSVLVVRHERKSGGDVGTSGRGSSAFTAAVDVAVTLRRLEGKSRPTLRELAAVSRFDGVPDELVIELTDDGYVSRGASKSVAFDEACAAILGAAPPSESDAVTLDGLCSKAGIARSTGLRAVKKLELDQRLKNLGSGKKGHPKRFFRMQ